MIIRGIGRNVNDGLLFHRQVAPLRGIMLHYRKRYGGRNHE